MRKYGLGERLIDFSVKVITIASKLSDIYVEAHLHKQLIRSGTSPAWSYGEVQGAGPRKDFIHKMHIGLKELRETLICIKMIQIANLIDEAGLEFIRRENNQLLSIFVKNIKTAFSKSN